MKTEDLPEIVEIIDDGADPFGDNAPRTSIQDTGGPRWVGPVAAAALVGLIGYGIATSASTTSAPKAEPAPTTIALVLPTNRQAPTTTVPQRLVPYYAAEPPRYLSVQYAEYQDVDRSYLGAGDYQLWATPGATATSGSWFSIQSSRTGPVPVNATNAYRMQIDEQSMAISHETTGQSSIQFSINGLMSISMTANGFSDEDLISLAQSVAMDGTSTAGDEVHLSDPALIAGFELISTVQPWMAVMGVSSEQVYYAASSNSIDGFTITVAPRRGLPVRMGTEEDRQIALRFFLDHSTPFEVDGRSAVAGEVVGQPGQALATWTAGDHVVSVSAPISVSELISLARTVHPVSAAEWEGMRFQASASDHDHGSDFEPTMPVPIASGTDAQGETWAIDVGATTYSNRQEVDWTWGGRGFSSNTDGTARIDTVVDGTRTYVLAELPRDVAPTAQLLVARSELDPVMVPFVDVDPKFHQTFAAYAFSEPGQYFAQIVGADGTILATWSSQ